MDSRKIRTYPPIIVSLIAAAIFFVVAVGQISESAERRVETRTAEVHSTPKDVQAAPMSLEIALPAEETGSESLIASRDWDAEESYMLMKIAMAEAEGESVEGMLNTQLEAASRVIRLNSKIATLTAQKSAKEASKTSQVGIITAADTILANEAEITAGVATHKAMLEQEKELIKNKAACKKDRR